MFSYYADPGDNYRVHVKGGCPNANQVILLARWSHIGDFSAMADAVTAARQKFPLAGYNASACPQC